MRFAARLASTVTWEVLHLGANRISSPASILAIDIGGLIAVDGGTGKVARKRGVLTKGAGNTAPPGLAAHVDLGPKQARNAHGAIALRNLVSNRLGKLGIKARRKGEVSGELAKVTRVCREVERNAVGLGLAVCLAGVVPVGLRLAITLRGKAQCRANAQVKLIARGHLATGGEVLGLLCHEGGVQHEGQLVIDRELLGPCRGTVLGALAPVLEKIQLTVAVEVLERIAVDLNDAQARLRAVREGCACILSNQVVAILLFLAPLCLCARSVRIDGVRVGRRQLVTGLLARGPACSEHRCRSRSQGRRKDEVPPGS